VKVGIISLRIFTLRVGIATGRRLNDIVVGV
jgi:hypothetical protein